MKDDVLDHIANSDKNDFRKFHDEMRRFKRRAFVNPNRNNGKPYVRPVVGTEIKGKQAKRAAKRARVAAMKAQQQ